MKHAQEVCDNKDILLVGLGLLEEAFHEVKDKEEIDDYCMIAFFGKKDDSVKYL